VCGKISHNKLVTVCCVESDDGIKPTAGKNKRNQNETHPRFKKVIVVKPRAGILKLGWRKNGQRVETSHITHREGQDRDSNYKYTESVSLWPATPLFPMPCDFLINS